MPIDIAQHLRNENYPAAIQCRRVWWGLLGPLFRWSPGPLNAWRNFLLRTLGARIGRGVRIHPTVQVMFPWNVTIADHVIIGRDVKLYALATISIDHDVLVSQGVHLCAGSHDYREPHFPIAHRPIRIETGTWLAADAFVGPGVTVGAGAVIGARAVALRDVPTSSVVSGNPAQVVKNLATHA